MGEYWLTTLSAIRERDPDWRAIAAYEVPVRRYLARRFPRLPEAEREDLLQEVLLAMRERIVPRYDPAAGRFRAFLQTSILNTVRDHLRRRRDHVPIEPEDLEAPDEEELDALDLEALLVRAVAEVHDRYASGPEQDLSLVYVLSGVLVHGLSHKAIAKREGLSADQVKRKLQRARGEILAGLFRLLLGPEAPVERCAELARACLRAPRKEARLLEREPDPRVRDAVGDLVRRLRTARGSLGVGAGEVDLLRGIEAVFLGS
ncbi:MAG: sigma-70 family RNA polymerase sigma factor [Planctomycetota bacterium]|nr:MAG: sigma-70 family RNA polymerase sigma factor [Planctomycetota bacterium]